MELPNFRSIVAGGVGKALKTISAVPFTTELAVRHCELLPDFKRLLQDLGEKSAWCFNLGCGRGRVSFELAPYVRWVLGVDNNARKIEDARRRAQNDRVNNVQFIVGDLEEMIYSDLAPTGSFQLMVTNLCISDEIISRVPEALEVGGHFAGTIFDSQHWRETGIPSPHSYSMDRLSSVLEKNGLEVTHLEVYGNIIQFDHIEQLEHEYLPEHLVIRWRDDGRWINLGREFQRGNRTLTESNIVFCARRAY